MRLRLTYLLQNFTRNPLRTLLTCLAVALPIAIYVLSVAVVDGIERFLDNSVKQLRLAVTHRISIVNPLPMGYRQKIEALDPDKSGLIAVCGMRYIGGRVENDPTPLSTLAVDPDTFPYTFPEFLTDPNERSAWERDRQAIVIGRDTAGQFGWKPGDRISIRPSVPPYTPMEFHVVSTTAVGNADPVANWCRMDYLREETQRLGFEDDWVSFYFVKCATPQDLQRFAREIDATFRNSANETFTQDEKAFMNQFITQQFDLPRNLTILAVVTVFVAIMAAANTMSMNFRDRISEFATLKAMGFGGGMVLLLILTESIVLCAVGGAAGALTPYAAFTYTPLKDFKVPVIQFLEIRPEICIRAMLIGLGVGVAAGVWPAWMALRLHVVNAFRSLE